MALSDRLKTLGTEAAGIAHGSNRPLKPNRIIGESVSGTDKGWIVDMNELVEDLNRISRLEERR